jgi:hypothetical protein
MCWVANADLENVDGGGSALVLDSQFGLGMSPFGGLVDSREP